MKSLVVDGTNIAMRSLKAAERSAPLSINVDDEEIPTGPTYLFINTFTKYVRQEAPDRLVVCWDGGRSRHRMSIYSGYKSQRLKSDDGGVKDLNFRLIKEFLTLSGIHHIEYEGIEADDLVAAYSRSGSKEGEVVILSGDKDFLQLVGERVSQIRPGVNPERWGPTEVETMMGCTPENLVKVMALAGDPQDGVPGVQGFGMKTAVKFLTKYEWDLEALLAAGEKKLEGKEGEVRRNYALVDLRHPIEGYLEDAYLPHFRVPKAGDVLYYDLTTWLRVYQMDSILNRLQDGTLWKDPDPRRFQGRLAL